MKVTIIGGGAAGFFASFRVKELHPDADVHILERGNQFLAKVRISGGGRCNVTHACFERAKLLANYPRGAKFLKEAFMQWMPQDMVQWLETRGVAIKTEADGRMFPKTDSSETIISCFLDEAQILGIQLHTHQNIASIEAIPDMGFSLTTHKDEVWHTDYLIVATGGSPSQNGMTYLQALGLETVAPVPSLFTFNLKDGEIALLAGISVPNVRVKIVGSKLQQIGDILITHWGLSGPAVLKLSAWVARELADLNYQYKVQVNWIPQYSEEQLREILFEYRKSSKKQIGNQAIDLPKRLWYYLLQKAQINPDEHWQEMKNNELNRLINTLQNDVYEAQGKTTYKDEFVTAGGVALSEIDSKTMQVKKIPRLFLAGEVLDIDAVTGGFNFQAAWATGYLAGSSLTK